MRKLVFALAVLLGVSTEGCAPIETDDPQDPAQVVCEGRGGDYLCKGFHPDGSLDCICIVP